MMLVPGCEGIGRLTAGLERVGTMRWVEPANLIDHARWAEFVRANFMWTFLLMQPRSDAKAGNAGYKALARLAAPLNGAPYHGTWETSVEMDPNTREEMGWSAEFEDWKSMQSTAVAKRLRAKDIMAQTGSMVANGCFQKNMLKAPKIKEADMVRPSKQQQPLFPEKWEGTIDRAQFLKRASTEKTSVMLTFSNKLPWNGIAGETDLWREMNFVTNAELYTDGPRHREYIRLVATPLHELT